MVNKAVEDALHDTNKYSIEYRINLPDGTQKFVHGMGEVERNKGNEPIRFFGTVHNITERRQAEEELEEYHHRLEDMVNERTLELREAQYELVKKERLATLGQLTATVSHELRNPLAAMRLSIYILNKTCDSNNLHASNSLDVVNRNIDRCDQIIDELLDFTRVTDLEQHSTDIDEWLELVIGEQNIPDEIQVENDFCLHHAKLVIDTNQLRRAIINVVENACQAMMDGNPHEKEKGSSRLHIKTQVNSGRIEIIISDTGIGIPRICYPGYLNHYFLPKASAWGLACQQLNRLWSNMGVI